MHRPVAIDVVTKASPVRDRILDAALRALGKSGIQTLVQPRVAREAGVPQGHLTYYFPKRQDLLAAVSARFVERLRDELPSFSPFAIGARLDAQARKRVMAFIGKLTKDRARTRTLISLVAASEEEPALRRDIASHVRTLRGLVAKLVDKPIDDPDVDLALATLWGVGLMHLILEDRTGAETEQLLARFHAKLEADRQAKA